jgi:nucleotide-binding universal stress UspA family protein
MKHFTTILTTTDLSPESLSTVQYAEHLAEAQGASLTVLHVVETTVLAYGDVGSPMLLTDLQNQVEAAARKKLEDWVRAHCKHVTASVVVKQGYVHDTICSTAADVGANLIVMATHGRRGFGHLLLGSVTERVLRDAPCPVLVVRPPAPAVRKKKAA